MRGYYEISWVATSSNRIAGWVSRSRKDRASSKSIKPQASVIKCHMCGAEKDYSPSSYASSGWIHPGEYSSKTFFCDSCAGMPFAEVWEQMFQRQARADEETDIKFLAARRCAVCVKYNEAYRRRIGYVNEAKTKKFRCPTHATVCWLCVEHKGESYVRSSCPSCADARKREDLAKLGDLVCDVCRSAEIPAPDYHVAGWLRPRESDGSLSIKGDICVTCKDIKSYGEMYAAIGVRYSPADFK
jgi:hypothetical protein